MRGYPTLALVSCVLAFGLLSACGSDGSNEGKTQGPGGATPTGTETPGIDEALDVRAASVRYDEELDVVVFEQTVTGQAGSLVPEAAGQVDGAPVLGYVFPTTLEPTAVGFGDVEGIVALAVMSHPDFDDTPLWDEDLNRNYDDDGAVYHSHWVVLVEDERAPAGLAARQAPSGEEHVLPPTAPMPMYLDSPGFHIVRDGDRIRVVVPRDRLGGSFEFRYDAVTALMRVDASGTTPLLAAETVYDVLSGDLSLPYEVEGSR